MSKKIYSGINIQYPISTEIMSGKKTIETRTYPIPQKYLNKEILLIETPGKNGNFKARATAIIKFTDCFQYESKAKFYSDFARHLVDPSSAWAWKDKAKWGWNIKLIKKFSRPIEIKSQRGIVFTQKINMP